MHAMAWAIAPTRNERLASLLERYGCPDVVAPVDAMAYGRRAGQVIGRALARPKAVPATEKPVPHMASAETQPGSLLAALGHAPRSDRLTLFAAASASVLLAGSTLLF